MLLYVYYYISPCVKLTVNKYVYLYDVKQIIYSPTEGKTIIEEDAAEDRNRYEKKWEKIQLVQSKHKATTKSDVNPSFHMGLRGTNNDPGLLLETTIIFPIPFL